MLLGWKICCCYICKLELVGCGKMKSRFNRVGWTFCYCFILSIISPQKERATDKAETLYDSNIFWQPCYFPELLRFPPQSEPSAHSTYCIVVTSWMLSSRLGVFPTTPSPLYTAIILSSFLSFLLKVQHLSPSYIRLIPASKPFSLQWSAFLCLSSASVHFPQVPPTTTTTPFSLHLSLASSPLCHSHRALYSEEAAVHCSLSPFLPLRSDHTAYVAFSFYPISHVPACLPAVGAHSPPASTLPAVLQ